MVSKLSINQCFLNPNEVLAQNIIFILTYFSLNGNSAPFFINSFSNPSELGLAQHKLFFVSLLRLFLVEELHSGDKFFRQFVCWFVGSLVSQLGSSKHGTFCPNTQKEPSRFHNQSWNPYWSMSVPPPPLIQWLFQIGKLSLPP